MRRLLGVVTAALLAIAAQPKTAQAFCWSCYLQYWPPYTACQGGGVFGATWCTGTPGISCHLHGNCWFSYSPGGAPSLPASELGGAPTRQIASGHHVIEGCNGVIIARSLTSERRDELRRVSASIAL